MRNHHSQTSPYFFSGRLVTLFLYLGLCGCAPPPDTNRIDEIKNVVSAHRVGSAAIKPGDRVAVMQFSGGQGRVLADLLNIALLRKGVDVVDRDSLDRVVAEVRRTESGLYDNDLSEAQIIAQIGKIVGADYVLVGETDAEDPPSDINEPGALGPTFAFAKSRLTMRMFSATDGAVLWLGTSETFVRSLLANDVFLLDYLRITAQRGADSLLDPTLDSDVKHAAGAAIRTTFAKNQGKAAPAPAPPAAPEPPPPETIPASPPASPSASRPAAAPPAVVGGCKSDAECKGNRTCRNGVCG